MLSFLRSPALQKFESFMFLADSIFYRSCVYLQHFRCAVPCLLSVFLKRKKGCSPDIMKGEGISVESVARNDIIA